MICFFRFSAEEAKKAYEIFTEFLDDLKQVRLPNTLFLSMQPLNIVHIYFTGSTEDCAKNRSKHQRPMPIVCQIIYNLFDLFLL